MFIDRWTIIKKNYIFLTQFQISSVIQLLVLLPLLNWVHCLWFYIDNLWATWTQFVIEKCAMHRWRLIQHSSLCVIDSFASNWFLIYPKTVSNEKLLTSFYKKKISRKKERFFMATRIHLLATIHSSQFTRTSFPHSLFCAFGSCTPSITLITLTVKNHKRSPEIKIIT